LDLNFFLQSANRGATIRVLGSFNGHDSKTLKPENQESVLSGWCQVCVNRFRVRVFQFICKMKQMIRSTPFDVDQANHRSGAAADSDKATLDHVGGAQFAPQMPGKGEERQQLRQILLQPPNHRRVSSASTRAESAKDGYGLRRLSAVA